MSLVRCAGEPHVEHETGPVRRERRAAGRPVGVRRKLRSSRRSAPFGSDDDERDQPSNLRSRARPASSHPVGSQRQLETNSTRRDDLENLPGVHDRRQSCRPPIRLDRGRRQSAAIRREVTGDVVATLTIRRRVGRRRVPSAAFDEEDAVGRWVFSVATLRRRAACPSGDQVEQPSVTRPAWFGKGPKRRSRRR